MPETYRSIEYTVRPRPARNQWVWSFHPKDAPAKQGDVTGDRERAVDAACRAIDRWLQSHPPRERE